MVERRYVERKCDQLVDAGFWPREQVLRYRAWLGNFDRDDEISAASTLLNNFVFINQDHASLAVCDGYARFIGYLHDSQYERSSRSRRQLTKIHSSTHFSAIRGESPSPAESGNAYMRIAREDLNVREERIHEIENAIEVCASGQTLVLIDDFSGTGNQVLNTLSIKDQQERSLLQLMDQSAAKVCCITAIMTSHAIARLQTRAPLLHLFPGYVANVDQYSLDTVLPRSNYPKVHRLLEKIAPRLHVTGMDPIRGMDSLGLLIGVHDRIPDSSLPILWADGDDWTPLKRRQA